MPETTWYPPEVDTTKPSVGRVYDYILGGAHNFAVDRDAAEKVLAVMPDLRTVLRANRAFLERAVRFLAERGIDQFLDLGSGIPTVSPVRDIAAAVADDVRVAYVDNDPITLAHGEMLLRDAPGAAMLSADLTQPDAVLRSVRDRGLLDLDRPFAVLMVSVVHFIPDWRDPGQIVAHYREALPAGGYLALSHAAKLADGAMPQGAADAVRLYSGQVADLHLRPAERIGEFFEGLEMVDPGLVSVDRWRSPDGAASAGLPQLAAVARRPG